MGDLKASLGAVHEVSDRERAELAVRIGGIALDRGEESLWAHALGRTGVVVPLRAGSGKPPRGCSTRAARPAGVYGGTPG